MISIQSNRIMIQSALYERPNGSGPQHRFDISHVAARIKTRATKRSIAFLVVEARPFDSGIFSRVLGAFERPAHA